MLFLLQHAVEKPPAKKAVVRLWLQRFNRVTGVGLVKPEQIVARRSLAAFKVTAELHLLVKHVSFVRAGARGDGFNTVNAGFKTAALTQALQHHTVPLQPLDHFAPGLRNQVSAWSADDDVGVTALKAVDVGFPRLAAVISQARVVAKLAGTAHRLEALEAHWPWALHVKLPMHRPMGGRDLRVFGGVAQSYDLRAVLAGKRQHCFKQRAGGGVAVGKGFEHVGFRHETDGVVQRRIAG